MDMENLKEKKTKDKKESTFIYLAKLLKVICPEFKPLRAFVEYSTCIIVEGMLNGYSAEVSLLLSEDKVKRILQNGQAKSSWPYRNLEYAFSQKMEFPSMPLMVVYVSLKLSQNDQISGENPSLRFQLIFLPHRD